VALWVLAVLLILIGAVGIVLPALPGVPLMFAGMVVAAAVDDFQRVGWVALAVLGFLTLLAVVVDFVASAFGAQRIGATRRAVWGAVVGTVVGLPFGLAGLILGPFIGAVVGEFSAHGRIGQAANAGVAAWAGLIFGTLVKVAIAFSMLGIFIAAFII